MASRNGMYVTSPPVFLILKRYRFLVAGFSMGPQSYIGQLCFALAETVCVLALLIRRYEVRVPVSPEGIFPNLEGSHKPK